MHKINFILVRDSIAVLHLPSWMMASGPVTGESHEFLLQMGNRKGTTQENNMTVYDFIAIQFKAACLPTHLSF